MAVHNPRPRFSDRKSVRLDIGRTRGFTASKNSCSTCTGPHFTMRRRLPEDRNIERRVLLVRQTTSARRHIPLTLRTYVMVPVILVEGHGTHGYAETLC